MDRVLIICGSAGCGGVTESMCLTAAEYLRGKGMHVRVMFPSNMRIGHCTGCDGCMDGTCVIRDDMDILYRHFSESDTVLLASPLHFSGPSSLIKTVMDRFQMFWHNGGLPHPSLMGALLCAGSDDPNFSHTLSIMRAFSITIGSRWIGQALVPGTDAHGDEFVGEIITGFLDSVIANQEDG